MLKQIYLLTWWAWSSTDDFGTWHVMWLSVAGQWQLWYLWLLLLVSLVDDVSDSALMSCHQLGSSHKPADIRHLLPLSIEAQFVREVIDNVSVLGYQIIHFESDSARWAAVWSMSSQCVAVEEEEFICQVNKRYNYTKSRKTLTGCQGSYKPIK